MRVINNRFVTRFGELRSEFIDLLFTWLEADDGFASYLDLWKQYNALPESQKADQVQLFSNTAKKELDQFMISLGLKKPPKVKKTWKEKEAANEAYLKAHPECMYAPSATPRHTAKNIPNGAPQNPDEELITDEEFEEEIIKGHA